MKLTLASTPGAFDTPSLAPFPSKPDPSASELYENEPVSRDSGTLRGRRAIAGGRRALRCVMYQARLVAAHHNPNLKVFAERLRRAGKPHKVIITAVARKLVTLANSLCKNHQAWAPSPP